MADEDVQTMLLQHHYGPAFETLLDRYQQKVFRLAYSILKEAAWAEDVAQDIFTKLWQVLPAYDGRASLSTWLYTIARNSALSAVRAQSYRKTLPLENYEPPSPPDSKLRELEIGQLLQRLPEPEQDVITLFYLQDRDIVEVARMLDLPEGTVKSHLHRARRRLAEWMKAKS